MLLALAAQQIDVINIRIPIACASKGKLRTAEIDEGTLVSAREKRLFRHVGC